MTAKTRFRRRWLALGLILVVAGGAIGLVVIRQNGGTTTGPCDENYPPGGAGSCFFQFHATVTVSSQSSGMVSVTVENLANYPFVSIGITSTSPSLNGLANSSPFTYNGTAVSASNPLQIGRSSSGSFTFTSGGSVGTNYTITMTATMTNGEAAAVQASFVASASEAGPVNSTSVVTDSKNDLQLRLFLNTSSSEATGVSISVLVDAYNPTLSTANVTSASDWVIPLNYTDGALCGDDTYAQNPTVGFAIAQGYVTSSNVTQGKLLDLVDPNATYNCPLYLGYSNPTGFLFQPLSDMATSYGCISPQTTIVNNTSIGSSCMSGGASTGLTSSSSSYSLEPGTGYWNQQGAFINFPKGTYTVLAEDEWGALALVYFTVA